MIITSIVGFVLNIFFDIIGLTPVEMLFGLVIGFAIPFGIGVIGKIILKQTAMGGGDIFLLGYGGLLIGWANTVLSFFIAALLGVIFYSIPALINLLNAKGYAKKLSSKIARRDPLKDLLLNFKLNNEKGEYTPKSSREGLTLFFYYYMMEMEKEGDYVLSNLTNLSNSEILAVLEDDTVGYGDFNENLKFLQDRSKKLNTELSKLVSEIEQKRYKYPNFRELKDSIATYSLDKLLPLHRAYQYAGYTIEQHFIEEYLIEHNPEDSKVKEAIAYDFYSDQYNRKFDQYHQSILDMSGNHDDYLYKLIIFKLYLHKQRLPLGPYLSIGMVITLVWGEQLIDWYLSLMMLK